MDNEYSTPILFDSDLASLREIATLLLARDITVLKAGKISEVINTIGFSSSRYQSCEHQILIIGLGERLGQVMDLVDFIIRFKSGTHLFLYRSGKIKTMESLFFPAYFTPPDRLEVHADDAINLVGQIERFICANKEQLSAAV